MVEKTVTGADKETTQYMVVGSNEETLSETNTTAYFNYGPAYLIKFAPNPPNITQLEGTNFYPEDAQAHSNAPGFVNSSEQGTRFQFWGWKLQNGEISKQQDITVTSKAPANIIAEYDKCYKLTLVSAYGGNEEIWGKADTEIEWKVTTAEVPMSGLGWLGYTQKAVNASGKTFMDSPKSINIIWQPNLTNLWILIAVVVVIAIVCVYFFYYRRKFASAATASPQAAPAVPSETKTELKTVSKAKSTEKPRHCRKCGKLLGKDEDFCEGCGAKVPKH